MFGVIAGFEKKTAARWELVFESEVVWVVPPPAAQAMGLVPVAVNHEEFAKTCTMVRNEKEHTVVMRLPSVKKGFSYPPTAEGPLLAWIRHRLDVHIKGTLAKRVSFGIPTGLFLIAMSVPWGPGMSISQLTLAIGVSLLVLTVLGWWRPRIGLFLFDAAIWVAIIANNTPSIIAGSRLRRLLHAAVDRVRRAGVSRLQVLPRTGQSFLAPWRIQRRIRSR